MLYSLPSCLFKKIISCKIHSLHWSNLHYVTKYILQSLNKTLKKFYFVLSDSANLSCFYLFLPQVKSMLWTLNIVWITKLRLKLTSGGIIFWLRVWWGKKPMENVQKKIWNVKVKHIIQLTTQIEGRLRCQTMGWNPGVLDHNKKGYREYLVMKVFHTINNFRVTLK